MRLGSGSVAAWLFCLTNASRAEYAINLPQPQSSVAQTAYDLHVIVLWVCLIIFAVVFGAMFYALFKHRRSLGHAAHPFHESTTVEVIWTLVPILILIGLAWPATRAVLAQKDSSNPDLTVKVTGYQWKWEYDYLHDGVRYMSNMATPRGGRNSFRSGVGTELNLTPEREQQLDACLKQPQGSYNAASNNFCSMLQSGTI